MQSTLLVRRVSGFLVLAIGGAASLAIGACGSSTSTNITAPSSTPARCQPSFDGSPRSFGSNGGTGTVAVTVSRECSWTAGAVAPWMSITSGSSGQGDGTIAFRVESNPDPVSRASALTINDGRVDVSQQAAACRFDVGAAQDPVAAAGGSVQIQIRTHQVCDWTAASDSSWASVNPAAGRGNGIVVVTVAGNTGAARSASVTAGGVQVPVTQAAPQAPPPPPAPPAPAPTPTPTPTPPPAPTPPPPAPTPPPPAPEPEEFDIEGRIDFVLGICPAVQFSVDDVVIFANAETKYKKGNCRDLERGERVRVKAVRLSSGLVQAREVEFR